FLVRIALQHRLLDARIVRVVLPRDLIWQLERHGAGIELDGAARRDRRGERHRNSGTDGKPGDAVHEASLWPIGHDRVVARRRSSACAAGLASGSNVNSACSAFQPTRGVSPASTARITGRSMFCPVAITATRLPAIRSRSLMRAASAAAPAPSVVVCVSLK